MFADLTGQFQLLRMDHQVLLGADYYDIEEEGSFFLNLDERFSIPIDLFNPVYGTVDVNAIKAQPPDFFDKGSQSWYGIYFQDQITLWDKLHILGGGRYDWAESSGGSSTTSFDDLRETTIEEEAFSPRVGLLYQPWPWLSLYGNYVESFGVSNGFSASDEPLPAPQSHRFSFANSFNLPGYARVDAFAAYHWKLFGSRLTAQLNIKNLLDKEYFYSTEPQNGGPSIYPGEPLTVIGTLRVEF